MTACKRTHAGQPCDQPANVLDLRCRHRKVGGEMSEIDCAASKLAVFSGVPRVQLEPQMKTPAPAVTGRGHGRTEKEFDSMSVPIPKNIYDPCGPCHSARRERGVA